MRKGLKILSTSLLLSTLFVAGCSCSKDDDMKNVSKMDNSGDALLKGLSDETSNYTLQDVYNALIASDAGNGAVASKLADFIADKVLKTTDPNSEWKGRYEALVAEKLQEKAEETTYQVKGKFSEAYFIQNLKNDGYKVTCPAGVTYGTTDDLACDYSDYINKAIRLDVLQTLLKEKYILDVSMKDRTNLLTSKEIRDVEYFTVSSSLDSEYDELKVREFIREIRDEIAEGKVVKFADDKTTTEDDEISVEARLKAKLTAIVNEEYAKIDTSKDYSNSIAAEYTNNFTQDKTVGLKKKLDAIADSQYAFSKLISSDSDAAVVVSEAITSTLLSIDNPTGEAYKRKVVAVKDSDNVTHYYLVNANAGTVVDASDVLLSETSDSSTYTYSIVRFTVIDSETTDTNKVYEAVKLLAKESTLGNGALSHYVKENKDSISVYDDEVKAYLETLYPDLFAEE